MRIIASLINGIFVTLLVTANTIFWLPVTFSAMISFAKEKRKFKAAFMNNKPPHPHLTITENHDGNMLKLFLVFPHIVILLLTTKDTGRRDEVIGQFLKFDSLRLVTLYAIAYYGRYA